MVRTAMKLCDALKANNEPCSNKAVATASYPSGGIYADACRGHAIGYAKMGLIVKYYEKPRIPRWLARNADFRWLQKNTDEISLWSNNALQSEAPYDKGRYGASALVGGKRIEVSCSEDIAVAMQMLVKLLYSKEWA